MKSHILIEQEISNLEDRNHLCLLYDKDPLEQMPALIPFIKQGLENNEQFIYITDDISIEQLILLLKYSRVDVDYEIRKGSLKLWTKNEWVDSDVDVQKEARKVRSLADDALSAGYSGIRLAVEMTWSLGKNITVEKLEKWETALNTIFTPEFPGKIICQYNRDKLPEPVISQAFRTHPHVIVDNCLCKNDYYEQKENTGRITSTTSTGKMITGLKKANASKKKKSGKQQLDLKYLRWGTHLCNFYNNKEDLEEILVPYFKGGLENNEMCMWVTSEPFNRLEAIEALKKEVPELDTYLESGQIVVIGACQWYANNGRLKPIQKVLDSWVRKEQEALKRGFKGLRVSGNTYWLEKKDWNKFEEYESIVNDTIHNYKMMALCSYPLDKCSASDIVDVVSNHQRTFIKKNGKISIIDNNESTKYETMLLDVCRDLENRINHRTEELSQSLEEKNILLKEIHHRVKNNLQVITSLLRLHANRYGDKNTVFEDCQNRIQSMALVHEELYKSNNMANLNLKDYIHNLGTKLFETYNLNKDQVSFEVNINDGLLDIDKSMSCGLILNELITNSIKYAFSGDGKGTIKVDFSTNDGNAKLTVSDDGVGLPKGYKLDDETPTLGMKLVKTLTSQLEGDLKINNGRGLTYNLEFPL